MSVYSKRKKEFDNAPSPVNAAGLVADAIRASHDDEITDDELCRVILAVRDFLRPKGKMS